MIIISPTNLAPYIQQLSQLLVSCVDHDSSIGFLPPLSEQQAKTYWHTVNKELQHQSKVILIMESQEQVVACVQLALVTKANGLHRAEVEKLMVRKSARGQGIATKLMLAVENKANQLKRSLLVLDTRKGDSASRLYLKLGFEMAGEIPNFALSASGDLDATVYFYKELP